MSSLCMKISNILVKIVRRNLHNKQLLGHMLRVCMKNSNIHVIFVSMKQQHNEALSVTSILFIRIYYQNISNQQASTQECLKFHIQYSICALFLILEPLEAKTGSL